jgi:small conductance mechanosensitive channel
LVLVIDVDSDALIEQALETGARVLLVVAVAYVANLLIRRLVTPLVRVAVREQMAGQPEVEVVKRVQTLTDVVTRTAATAIAVIAVVTILPEFGINAGPLIAGLGIVGLAVGFGAQNLVKDLINGVEILTENQYAQGDYVGIRTATGGSVNGIVEDVNLRRTVLRDFEGNVHFVAHGQIDVASNYTKGFSRVVLNLAVANSADLGRVYQLVRTAGEEMKSDAAFGPMLREAPAAAGIDRLGEASLEVRVEAVTEPGDQWRVASELRRRLKLALDAAGIKSRD